MFGLSTKEILTKAIINTSKNNIGLYKQKIMANVDVLKKGEETTNNEVLLSAYREYLNEVADSVISTLSIDSPRIAMRAHLALSSPRLCGYEDIDTNNGLIAGSLYAICFYAITNKIADPSDCIRMNHMQNDIVNMALADIDEKLSV